MGSQIIVQPNGLLARFSSGVDGFTFYDATDEEMVEYIVERAVQSIRRDAQAAVADARKHGTSATPPFNLTWDRALALHNQHWPDNPLEVKQRPDSGGGP